jgi:hypothetical protein
MNGAAGISARITERIERLRTLEGDLRSATPPVPRSAKIELTSRCNYACRFCSSHLRNGRQHDMPWPLYTRLAQELRRAGVEQLGLFYIGESLLYPRLEDAVRYAKQDCGYPYVFLTTNGSLATVDRVTALMRAGLDSLKFALNFADGEQAAHGAGIPQDMVYAVARNVMWACDARDAFEAQTGKRCVVSASSLKYDDDQPRRMAPLINQLTARLDQHYWLPIYGRAATWQPCIRDTKGLSPSALARKDVPCWPLYTEAHITVDGRLSACGLDHAPRFHMADLNAVCFADAWHSPAFRSLREAHLRGDVSATPCAQCVGYTDANN